MSSLWKAPSTNWPKPLHHCIAQVFAVVFCGRGQHEPQADGWGIFLSKSGVDQFDYTSSQYGDVHRFAVRLPQGDSSQPFP